MAVNIEIGYLGAGESLMSTTAAAVPSSWYQKIVFLDNWCKNDPLYMVMQLLFEG